VICQCNCLQYKFSLFILAHQLFGRGGGVAELTKKGEFRGTTFALLIEERKQWKKEKCRMRTWSHSCGTRFTTQTNKEGRRRRNKAERGDNLSASSEVHRNRRKPYSPMTGG